jgi:low affinity Fe/Cu permease
MNTTSSIVTFMMVFIIANAQKRDTDALNLKLDMLIAADERLSNKAVGLEAAPLDRALEVRDELGRVLEKTERVIEQTEEVQRRSQRADEQSAARRPR